MEPTTQLHSNLTWNDIHRLTPTQITSRVGQNPWQEVNALTLELINNPSQPIYNRLLGNKLSHAIKEIELPKTLVFRLSSALVSAGVFDFIRKDSFCQRQKQIPYTLERSIQEQHNEDVVYQVCHENLWIPNNAPEATVTKLFRILCKYGDVKRTALQGKIALLLRQGANRDDQEVGSKRMGFDDYIDRGGNIDRLFFIAGETFRQTADLYIDANLALMEAACPGDTMVALSDISIRTRWMNEILEMREDEQKTALDYFTGTRLAALAQFIESSYHNNSIIEDDSSNQERELAEAVVSQVPLAAQMLKLLSGQKQDQFLTALSPQFRETFSRIYLGQNQQLINEKQTLVGKFYALWKNDCLGSISKENEETLDPLFNLAPWNSTQCKEITESTENFIQENPAMNVSRILADVLQTAEYVLRWDPIEGLTAAVKLLNEIAERQLNRPSPEAIEKNREEVVMLTRTKDAAFTRIKYDILQKICSNPDGSIPEDLDIDEQCKELFDGFDADQVPQMPNKKTEEEAFEKWKEKTRIQLCEFAHKKIDDSLKSTSSNEKLHELEPAPHESPYKYRRVMNDE